MYGKFFPWGDEERKVGGEGEGGGGMGNH